MLYVQIEKALYGMLRADLLLYRKLRAGLEDTGFEVNPYDSYMANKIVNESQCANVWHVDDLKVSHKDEAVVTYFAQALGHRNRDKLKIKRGKVFVYLGMDLDFESCLGTMIISTIKYLYTMIEEWPEELKGCTPNSHQDHLFEVRADDDPKKVSLLSVWGQKIYFFSIFLFYALFGMLLKCMGERFLLSKDESLTPDIDGVMVL